jgi:UDP-N-acetylmuramoylalanine--D-glutamate ligase
VTPATTFAGRKVALFGLGGSGLVTALALQAGGARVVACDDDPERMAKAAAQGVETGDLRALNWSAVAALILSPGVPLTHPEPHWSAKLAKAAGVEIIGDIELFCREREKLCPDAPFIAITGTNGKSTTTALVAHILREAGRDVQVGGNIGTAILSLEPPAENRFHVVEMSSFQIDLTPSLRPTVGVLLNISPDHLDRHGTMEEYAAIKERVVDYSESAVVGMDDSWGIVIASRRWAARKPIQHVSASSLERILQPPAQGIYVRDGELRLVENGQDFGPLATLNGVATLRGEHNAQNAAAAVAALLGLAVETTFLPSDSPILQQAFATFPGLPHRMEEVGRRAKTLFINDSKATNADSTAKALASFDHVFWILGGQPKEGGITVLQPYFERIERAYLIGAATEAFAATLDGHVPFERCGTLDRAVERAAADAAMSEAEEPVVLLSPACASYDQFPNYEKRGNRFRELVRALPGVEPKG